MEKLKSAGLIKPPQVPVNEIPPQFQSVTSQQRSASSSSATKREKRRRSSTHEDEEPWQNKKSKNATTDRLSVLSNSSSSNSSSSSSQDTATVAPSRNSYPLDRLNNNNNIDHKPPSHKEAFFHHSPNSVDTKLTKIKREQQRVSPLKESKVAADVKPRVKQERPEIDDSSGVRNRSHSMNSSQSYKDSKRKKIKASHDDNLNGTSTSLAPMPPTNHDRMMMANERLLANGDLTSSAPTIAPSQPTAAATIIRRIFVSYFERNNENSEQPEMR
jgi:hypothetical protein